jgi:hypothetical protein
MNIYIPNSQILKNIIEYIYFLHGVCGELIFFLESLGYKMKGGLLLPHKVVHPHACQFSIDGN